MLTDITFYSWDQIQREKDYSEEDKDFIFTYWKNNLSPEALRSKRIQTGVYKDSRFDNLLNMDSRYKVVNRWMPVADFKTAMKVRQKNIEEGKPLGWFGRGDSVEQIIEYLKPTWEIEDRYFLLQVQEYENAEELSKPWKMGHYINNPDNTYERMQQGFWTFHMFEINE